MGWECSQNEEDKNVNRISWDNLHKNTRFDDNEEYERITLRRILGRRAVDIEADGTGSVTCSTADFGINGVEPSDLTATVGQSSNFYRSTPFLCAKPFILLHSIKMLTEQSVCRVLSFWLSTGDVTFVPE
jgi:hypothetical protein